MKLCVYKVSVFNLKRLTESMLIYCCYHLFSPQWTLELQQLCSQMRKKLYSTKDFECVTFMTKQHGKYKNELKYCIMSVKTHKKWHSAMHTCIPKCIQAHSCYLFTSFSQVVEFKLCKAHSVTHTCSEYTLLIQTFNMEVIATGMVEHCSQSQPKYVGYLPWVGITVCARDNRLYFPPFETAHRWW